MDGVNQVLYDQAKLIKQNVRMSYTSGKTSGVVHFKTGDGNQAGKGWIATFSRDSNVHYYGFVDTWSLKPTHTHTHAYIVGLNKLQLHIRSLWVNDSGHMPQTSCFKRELCTK